MALWQLFLSGNGWHPGVKETTHLQLLLLYPVHDSFQPFQYWPVLHVPNGCFVLELEILPFGFVVPTFSTPVLNEGTENSELLNFERLAFWQDTNEP